MTLLPEFYDQIDPRHSFVPIRISKPAPIEDEGVMPEMSEWWFDHEPGPLFDELTCVMIECFEILTEKAPRG